MQTEGGDGKGNAAEGLEEGQAKSDCTDEQHDLDGEVGQDGRGSCGGSEYEKGGEMERVLGNQAALIGQYEAQENAQREWEKKFNGSRDSTSVRAHLLSFEYQQRIIRYNTYGASTSSRKISMHIEPC